MEGGKGGFGDHCRLFSWSDFDPGFGFVQGQRWRERSGGMGVD